MGEALREVREWISSMKMKKPFVKSNARVRHRFLLVRRGRSGLGLWGLEELDPACGMV